MKRLVPKSILIISMILFSAKVVEAKISHEIWHNLLTKYVSTSGNVNYSGFKSDTQKLQSYIDILSKNEPQETWTKNERMAYWINAYNAFTVKLILDHMPLKSIMEIDDGKAWDKKFIKIGNKTMSLNNIEHDILRAKYKDARIHFAVNCASVSCPKINNSAFVPKDLESQLNKMAVSFINNNSKNSLSADQVQISSLFDWYKNDFTKEGSIIDFLNKYSKTKINSNAKISYMEYNWNLNS